MMDSNVTMETAQNFGNLIFLNFCKLCEAVSSSNDRKIKVKKLKEYIISLREKYPEANFHMLLRFLLPYLDRDRGPYGIKEHNLATIYIRILDLPKEGNDATMLLKYRRASIAGAKDADFAGVAYMIFQQRCGESTNLKLSDVNNYLDRLAVEHAAHRPRAIDDILIEMMNKMSAIEQKWLIRIILKNLHLGLGTKSIMHIYHPDSMEVYDVSNSLLKVTTLLKNENVRLRELEISVFVPFRPMLSERCDVNKIDFMGEYFIDEKLDGERFQIHHCNGKFKYFSRNAFDFTNNFGEDIQSGYFTSMIARQIKNGVESFILDGEMMGWHTKRKCFVTKASNIDVKSLRIGDAVQSCFCAFDIVYYNGTVLTNKPLIERLAILEKVFEPLEGVIAHTPRIKVSKCEDILKSLNSAIDNQLEGIILKEPNSLYKANARKSGWHKIKPEYSDGALVELDLLIVGGYYGEGKWKGKICRFLLGLGVSNNEVPSQLFSSMCRVGSGYTFVELNNLIDKLNPHWQKFRSGREPRFLLLSKEKPDVWIEPKNSCIVQVKASEVVKSDLYHFGYTLRFPRVESVRYNKPWDECLTTTSFANIIKVHTAKLTSGHVGKKRDSRGCLITSSSSEKIGCIEKIGDVFNGKEICILTGTKAITKTTLEKMINEQGGMCVNAPGAQTYCVIAGDLNIRVKNVISSKKHIVVSPQWLQNCSFEGKLLPFEQDHVLSAPKGKKIAIVKSPAKISVNTVKSLQNLIDRIPVPQEGLSALPDKMILKLEKKLFGGLSPYSVFRGIHVHFYSCSQDRIISSTEEILFKFHSGIIDEFITNTTNFIVIRDISIETRNSLQEQIFTLQSQNQILIVNKLWIFDCCSEKKLIKSENYIVNL